MSERRHHSAPQMFKLVSSGVRGSFDQILIGFAPDILSTEPALSTSSQDFADLHRLQYAFYKNQGCGWGEENLGTRHVRPLTKRRSDGTLYTRRAAVEEALAKLIEKSREEIVDALKIRDPSSPLYVKSECIVYLIRDTRHDNDESYFNELYRELMRRLSSALPRVAGERTGVSESVHATDARDRVKDTFVHKLIEDRAEPGGALDYFEVMFADAIAALRTTSMHRARRQAARTEAIEADEETNEPSLAVEHAVGSLDLKEELLSEDPIYRSRIADAIRSLPDKLRRVVELIMRDMPIDSSDDSVMTIRKAIGVKSEKTVRNRRDEAYVLIRQALSIGDDHD